MPAIAYQSSNIGSGANITITKPASSAVGDVFLALICCYTTGTTGPAGWTKDFEGSLNEGGNTMGMTIWSHVVDGGEGASFQWTQASTCVGVIVNYRNARNPVIYNPTTNSFQGNVSTNPSANGVTTTVNGVMALACIWTNTLNQSQISGSWTNRATGNLGTTGTCMVLEKIMTTAGATGSHAWTDANTSKWSATVIGLAPPLGPELTIISSD